MWVALALGAAFLTSFNSILYKRMLPTVGPVTLVWGVTTAALPILAIFTLWLTPGIPSFGTLFLPAVVGSALLNTVAHLASTRALESEDASVVTPLLIFSPVFTLLIAIVTLGEMPTPLGIAGVFLVLIGAYFLNYELGQGWSEPIRRLSTRVGVLWVLLAGLIWAITPILEKLAIEATEPNSPRLVVFVIDFLLVIFLTPSAWQRRAQISTLLHSRRVEFGLAGGIAGVAPVLGFTALSLGLVGYVTVLFKLSTLLTVIWAGLLLREAGVRRRLPSAGLMVVGAILIASA